MGARSVEFAPGEIYHVYSRGVDKRDIFLDTKDYTRLFRLLTHCLPEGHVPSLSTLLRLQRNEKKDTSALPEQPPVKNLVDLLCDCFMPNHLHLLLRESVTGGISRYLQRLLNSYARYFNTRHARDGSLFGGRFQAVHIATTEQLLHVSRYIHLNPYVAGLVKDPFEYPWSSLGEYIGERSRPKICDTALIAGIMPPLEYRAFVADYAGYARELARAKKEILIDTPR